MRSAPRRLLRPTRYGWLRLSPCPTFPAMPNYRRAFVAGGCWFFTVNLFDRRRHLLTENIQALRAATRLTQTRHPFTIDAMVVLPDHLHAVWTLPEGDADFPLRRP